MSSAPGPAEIAADATWLAQALDAPAGLARLVRMTPEAYRAAAFLDDRMMTQAVAAQVVPWAQVAAALAADTRRDARWIFHIGHVGSTLVSRLLGELDGVLAVREPRLLRDIAGIGAEQRRPFAEAATALCSRTFARGDIALVKATSFVSEIAPGLVPAGGRALLVYATPRGYIEGILAGENSVKELRMLVANRRQRMVGRVSPFSGTSDAEFAAEAWACEMTSLEAAAEGIGEASILWADFDRMLGDMAASLTRAAAFLAVPATAERLREIVAGPLMQRYSKALEYDYSPALRRDLLAQARADYGGDIDSALKLLHNAAKSSPLLERALARAET
ncbi:MAG: hypothetical protein ABIW16_04645 [Sphingomicrobium sp.]